MRKVLIVICGLSIAIGAGLFAIKKTDLFLYRYITRYVPPDFSGKPALVLLGDSQISRGDWRVLQNRFHVINLGIGGSTTGDLTKALTGRSVRSEVVLVHIGVNDLRYDGSVEETAARIAEIAARLKDCGSSSVVLSGIFPLKETSDLAAGTDNREIALMNAWIRRIAREEGCRFFSCFDSAALITPFLNDGLHLNEAGYKYLERALDNFLK